MCFSHCNSWELHSSSCWSWGGVTGFHLHQWVAEGRARNVHWCLLPSCLRRGLSPLRLQEGGAGVLEQQGETPGLLCSSQVWLQPHLSLCSGKFPPCNPRSGAGAALLWDLCEQELPAVQFEDGYPQTLQSLLLGRGFKSPPQPLWCWCLTCLPPLQVNSHGHEHG